MKNYKNQSRVVVRFAAFFLCLLLTLSARAEMETGFIRFGAFVMSLAPDQASSYHKRVGYLPIGAVVSYDTSEEIREIFNHDPDVQDYERYVAVKSNLGFTGLVKENLVTRFGEDTLLVPLGYRIYIRDVETGNVIGKVTRARSIETSMPVTVVDETDHYYIVELAGVKHKDDEGIFSYTETDNPVDEQYINEQGKIVGKISKGMVRRDKLIKLIPDDYKTFPVVRIRNHIGFSDEQVDSIIAGIKDKLDSEVVNKIIQHLEIYGDLQCRLSAEADAAINAKFLGTGFGFNAKLMLAGKESVFSLGSIDYSNNGHKISKYYEAKDVECKNGNPSRMRAIVFLDKDEKGKYFHLKKDELPDELKQSWKTFNRKQAYKMINVSGIEDYNIFMKHLEDAEFFNNMTQDSRLVMKHMLLKEVANFRTPRD